MLRRERRGRPPRSPAGRTLAHVVRLSALPRAGLDPGRRASTACTSSWSASRVFFSVCIVGALIVFAIKLPPPLDTTSGPSEIHGSLLLELTWTVIPFCITIVIFVWGASSSSR